MHSLNQPSRPYFRAFFIDLLSRKEANSHDPLIMKEILGLTQTCKFHLNTPSWYFLTFFCCFSFFAFFDIVSPFHPIFSLSLFNLHFFLFLRFFLSICFPLVYRLINSLFCLSSDATDSKFNSPSAVTLYTSAIYQHPKHHSEKMFNGVWNVSSQMYF